MVNVVKVAMSDLKVVRAPQRLLTTGLGSCIGVCLFDPQAKIAGMAHIMLPDSRQSRGIINPAKFADTAVPILIKEMERLGAEAARIVAKIAGGAQMFAFSNTNEIMRVGERNTQAVLAKLREEHIPVLVNETGGNFGRTIEFDASNGKLYIRTIDKGDLTK